MSKFLDGIEACIPDLRRYARALTNDPWRSDDLVQECLEKAIKKQAYWRPIGSQKSWLMKILLNDFRNEMRRRRREGVRIPIDSVADDLATRPAQPGRLALVETGRALASLPLEQKEALLLVVLEGMNYSEAAEILGISMGTLMSRLGRARAKLRLMTSEDAAASEEKAR